MICCPFFASLDFNLKNEISCRGCKNDPFFLILFFWGVLIWLFCSFLFLILKMSLGFYKRTYIIYKQNKIKKHSIQKIPGLNAITGGRMSQAQTSILFKSPRQSASASSCAFKTYIQPGRNSDNQTFLKIWPLLSQNNISV